jgi:hypothetical protein
MSMINLMPPAEKEALNYARRNSALLGWIISISIAAVGILVVAGGGLFYLKQDTKTYSQSIDQTKAELVAQNEAETLARITEISGNLKLSVDVLSHEVLFSKLLQQIGEVMPTGTILQDLSISNDLTGGIDLLVGAASYRAGTQAQVNLADKSNNIFEKADIVSLICREDEETDPRYPCILSVRALFLKDNNPFLLMNQDGEAGQ